MTVSILLIGCALSFAQAQTFEAASIHRNLNGGGNTQIKVSGGRLTVTNGSVKTLIRNAYSLLGFQLAGEPKWLDTEMYDIVASTGEQQIEPDKLKVLLQNLLADRFGLKVHWETREGSVYALLVDKNGPKFQESTAETPIINNRFGAGRAEIKCTGEPISILSSNLAHRLGRFVVDRTGLHGKYDFLLVWDPDPTPESTNPLILTAVQQQLGLKLEATKGPMEILVVDRVEKASDN